MLDVFVIVDRIIIKLFFKEIVFLKKVRELKYI